MSAYPWLVGAGIVAAAIVRRVAPGPKSPNGTTLLAAAAMGALGGATMLELPADWLGWTAGAYGAPIAHGLGGRTVLGGLLGGWIAVEWAKHLLGVRRPTGDGFAAPLSVALAFGRVGCALTGCCSGAAATPGARWAALAVVGPDGVARFPAPHVEIAFHALAALVLLALAARGRLENRRFALYAGAYAVVRFALERVRDNPKVALGMTYYQLLAIVLFAVAATTFVRRSRRAPTPA